MKWRNEPTQERLKTRSRPVYNRNNGLDSLPDSLRGFLCELTWWICSLAPVSFVWLLSLLADDRFVQNLPQHGRATADVLFTDLCVCSCHVCHPSVSLLFLTLAARSRDISSAHWWYQAPATVIHHSCRVTASPWGASCVSLCVNEMENSGRRKKWAFSVRGGQDCACVWEA